jgi:hypothetical protein
MADRHTRVERTGFLGELGRSILAIPVGLLLFFGSFFVLWFTEGRTDVSEIAAESAVLSNEAAEGAGFVSVSGTVGAKEPLGDPEFLAPGPWLSLQRRAEMFAWVEHRETEERNKIGGGKETITYFEYRKEWTNEPKPSSSFDNPVGHDNPPMHLSDQSFASDAGTIGAWMFDAREADLPGGEGLELTSLPKAGTGANAKAAGEFLHIGRGDLANPIIGDLRVSFTAVPTGISGTLFGQAEGGRIGPYVHEGEHRVFRLFRGSRDEALLQMHQEYVVLGWVGRVAGFLLMWIGMSLVFAPLHAVMDILPFLGRGSRFLVGVALFPVALVLTTVTTLISMILHNFVAAVAVALLLAGLVVWGRSRRKATA